MRSRRPSAVDPWRIKLTSIMVDNQSKAPAFYTEILGFVKKHENSVGEYPWLTVVSPEGPDDLELSLEPNANLAGSVSGGDVQAGDSRRVIRSERS